MNLSEELIHFGKDQIKVLGKERGGMYLKRCFEVWLETYGEAVTSKIRGELMKAWKEAK